MCFRLWYVYWVPCSVHAARHSVHIPQPETHAATTLHYL